VHASRTSQCCLGVIGKRCVALAAGLIALAPAMPAPPLQIPELNQQGPVHVQPRRRRGRGNDQWQDSRPRPEQQAASSERQLFVNNLGLDISREAVGHHFEQ